MAAADHVPEPGPKRAGTIAFMLRALKYRNYRLFFGGQIVSLTGTWITATATSWLVYRLTGSAMLLGVVAFAGQFPSFLLMPFSGTLVDRWNRHRLLVTTQVCSMLQSFALAALTLTGTITMPWLIALSVVQAVVNAFDMPVRQAFVATLVEDKRDLGNAIALNSSMFNVARLLGPAIGGAIIAASSEGWCFFIDGVSFLAVIASLLAMTVRQAPRSAAHASSPIQQFREGWRYASRLRPIRAVLTLVALVCLMGVPYTVLLPIFAGTIFHGGAHTLGFLMTATGAGALLGALWLASRRSTDGLGETIAVASAVFGAGLIAFAASRVLWVSVALLFVTSVGFMVQVASCNTLLQTIVDDAMRGRVMSFFLMAYFGTTPFGSLIAGALSERVGAPMTLAIGGVCCLAGTVWFALGLPAMRRDMAPLYAAAASR